MRKKILTFFITSICLLLWACNSFALVTQYQEAIDAFKRKDFKTAYELILPLAKKGFSKAQYSLGMMYEKGKGVDKDSDKAKKWFQFAADQGLAKAQEKIDFISEKRLKPKQEDNPIALAGNHINLNTISLKNGLDALNNKNYASAHKLFLELAEQGDVEAQYNLGLMYGKGKGVQKNYSEAVKWWGLAAEQGNGKAQTNLGWMYEIGKGVLKDENKAAHWYQIASSQGISKAQEKLNSLLNKTKKNLQVNTTRSSDKPSQVNTKSLTTAKDDFDAPRHSPDAFTEPDDETNDSDRLHAAQKLLDNKEFATAHKLFLDLADKGIAEAQINLGMMFEAGQGVLQDYAEAIRRYRLAANLGLIEAQEKLDLLINKMQEHLLENPASANEFKSPKETQDIQMKTTSFPSELNQNESKKNKPSELTDQSNKKIKQEQLESISDSLSELNTGSTAFDGDAIIAASYNPGKSKAYYSTDFKDIAVEPSPQKNIDPPRDFSEQFSASTAKDISQNNSSVTTPSDQVLKYLDKWARSWEKQDTDLYLSFYVKSFKGLEEKHLDWRISRQAALKRHTNISIQIKDIQISSIKDTLQTNFTQSFESDSYSDIGIKKLVWVKNRSDWRIIKEIWVPQKNHN